jgi:hypothetical protein
LWEVVETEVMEIPSQMLVVAMGNRHWVGSAEWLICVRLRGESADF